MNQLKIVLESTKSQLEAQKKKVYDDAYSLKYAELKVDIDAYVSEKNQEYNDYVAELKSAYEQAVAEKRKQCDSEINVRKKSVDEAARVYASKQSSLVDELINGVATLIEKSEA